MSHRWKEGEAVAPAAPKRSQLAGPPGRGANNLLYQNRGADGDCSGGGAAQFLYRTPLAGFQFTHNGLFNAQTGENVIQEEFGSGNTVAEYERQFPAVFDIGVGIEGGKAWCRSEAKPG